MPNDIEYSESGAPIYRHKDKPNAFVPPVEYASHCQQIEKHVERHIGKVDSVFHEILSHLVHIDVLIVTPTRDRDFWTLITSGMSDMPMAAPPECAEFRRAELMLCLPKSWPIPAICQAAGGKGASESIYWPIRWLKALARLPHEYDTWLGWGHTVPNGDPARAFAPNTKLCCCMLLSPVTAPDDFAKLVLNDDEHVHFYSLIPLYSAEMDFKLKHGADPLVDKLVEAQVTELLDINRRNTCRKKWLGLF